MTALPLRAGFTVATHTPSPQAPRRVLHIVLDLHEGGLERLVVDLLQGCNAGGMQASVLCLKRPGRLANEVPAGLVQVASKVGAGSLLLPLSLATQIRRAHPDLVHLHSGVWMKGAYASRLAGVRRVLFTDHGRMHPDPLGNRVSDRVGAACTDRVVAVSDALAAYLHDKLLIPRRKICVIPNGVTMAKPASTDEVLSVRDELQIPEGALIVGAVGRLDPVKAYDLLIDALAELRSRVDGIREPPVLLLVGDGPERESLTARAAARGLAGAVRFVGWRRDVPRLLAAMDVFALCSDSEGTSLALLEAMAAGRPVIATAVGGNPAVLGELLAGQLIPPRDLNRLVELLSEMLKDQERRDEVSRIARQTAQDDYAVTRMISRYQALYDDLLSS